MMENWADRAIYYRNKAEEVATIASDMKSSEARRFLVTVAADYVMLAEALERAQISDPLPASE